MGLLLLGSLMPHPEIPDLFAGRRVGEGSGTEIILCSFSDQLCQRKEPLEFQPPILGVDYHHSRIARFESTRNCRFHGFGLAEHLS